MKKPNIVLIVMDAVRARNMSIYGYKEKTTPMLESIRHDFTLYRNAISSSYWTLPSHASIFTGTYASKHGLVADGDSLKPSFVTMAELLHAKGYKTVALCRNPYVSGFSRLDRGFDLFYDFRHPSVKSILSRLLFSKRRNFTHLTAPALKQRKKSSGHAKSSKRSLVFEHKLEDLQELGIFKKTIWFLKGFFDKHAENINALTFKLIERFRAKPFFLFLHFGEAHAPYEIPRIFRNRFLTFKSTRKPWDVNQDHRKYYFGKVKMTEADFRVLEALYNGAISYLDRRIYEIYSFLQHRELLDNTLLIITSDHGENLGDHGILFHHFCLYDSLIRIPLLVKYPAILNTDKKPCETEERIVQNVDLLPTIMDILRTKEGKILMQVQGNSLVTSNIKNRDYSYAISELMEPFRPALREAKIKLKRYDRRLISIRTASKKFIHSSDRKHEFYDLEKDPNEINNLIDSGEPCISELKEKLRPWLKKFNNFYNEHKRKSEVRINMEDIEAHIKNRLKKMGYF